MIESPIIGELMAENSRKTMRSAILKFLVTRSGPDARKLRAALGAIHNDKQLTNLIDESGRCLDPESFKKLLEP